MTASRTFLSLGLTAAALFLACGEDTVAPSTPVASSGTTPVAGTPAAAGGSAGAVSPGTTSPSGGAGRTGTSPSTTPGAAAGSSATTGAAGAPTTAGAAAGSGAAPAASGGNGYRAYGRFKGYAFLSAEGMGSTVMPMDFSMAAADQPLCISGSVAADPDYKSLALLGVSLNQESGTDPPKMTVMPMGAGLAVKFTNKAMSPLRLQIQGPNGGSDANDRWCATISGGEAMIPWASFNTACWDGSGTAYANQPLEAAIILVPGQMASAVAYDFCLDDLREYEAGAGAAGGGAAMPTAGGAAMPTAGGAAMPTAGGAAMPASNMGMLSERYESTHVMQDGRDYVIQNNVWGNDAMQTLSYNGTSFKVDVQSGGNGTAGAPVSYPSTFIGSNNDRATTGSNLPKQVSSLTTVPTSWSHNANGSISGIFNASYDVWFSTGAMGDPKSPSGGYLMVWLYDPPNAQPIGNVMNGSSGVTIPGVPGSWDVWFGDNQGTPCISYLRTQPTQSMDFDLNVFIKDAVGRGAVQSSWYLSNVFAGFEIWAGGVGLESKGFKVVVN